ncbi:MAG: hypothetical protein MUW56_21300 [Chryseobacterium sp.]|uniref:hypothetical protein n=1 Tax=Chryseobacterium sp. TaxID=1871047 RepID=UPI0025C2CE74|nr:hypothetical protein [Chryseobacterium sp.]MCJ7936092.1 hypothetical protein [Chryseobacterium sp.]
MYSITNKINIGKKALIQKDFFINDEISPSAATKFTCNGCGHENSIEIVPYQSGFPILQLYHENKVVSQDELLKNRMVTETSPGMLYFGKLTLDNLPTLYFGTDCPSCHSKYICVFSYGEKQPGLTVLHISGVWKYEVPE